MVVVRAGRQPLSGVHRRSEWPPWHRHDTCLDLLPQGPKSWHSWRRTAATAPQGTGKNLHGWRKARHHSLSLERGRKVPLYPKRGRATEDICPQCRATWARGWPGKWTSHHHTSRPAGLIILGMGEARAWGAVLAEEKGLELKVEQEQWGTPSAEPTPPQVQGYARGDWSQCGADGNHEYRTQASSTPHQTDLTCTCMQTGICTHAYMHTCVCTHGHIYMHVCACTHKQTCTHACTHRHTHIHGNMFRHIHIHAYVYTCIYVFTCVHILWTYMCTRKHVLMHVHTYAYTHNMHRCVVHSHELKCMLMHACIIHMHKHTCALLHTHTLMPSRKELLYSFPSSTTVDLSPHCVTPDAQHLF